jgi:hypothetical protein
MTRALVSIGIGVLFVTSSASQAAEDCRTDGDPKNGCQLLNQFDVTENSSHAKFGIGGPFYIGDPVHETITLIALERSGIAGGRATAASYPEFIRGVFWNDDPCYELFDNSSIGLTKSTGLLWFRDFHAAETASKSGAPFSGLTCRLLGRSHFGDLQFFHGMASRDGVKSGDTLSRMMLWAEFTYAVAIGSIDPEKTVQVVRPAIASVLELGAAVSVERLFLAANAESARQRAIGSLVHLLQDSYAAGHTEREIANGDRGPIIQFYSYAGQDHGRHAEDDKWRGGGDGLEKIKAIKGGPEALAGSTRVLGLYRDKRPWSEVERYLQSGPWAMVAKPELSSPGKNYAKRHQAGQPVTTAPASSKPQ